MKASSGLTWSEIALEVCSGGGESDAGVPVAVSARNGTRLEYLSMYASRVTASQKEMQYQYAEKKLYCRARRAAKSEAWGTYANVVPDRHSRCSASRLNLNAGSRREWSPGGAFHKVHV